MKNRRLIIESVLVVLGVGLLGWQQRTIRELGRELGDVATMKAIAAPIPSAPQSGRRREDVAGSRSPGGGEARVPAKRPPDLASLQAENQALRRQNEALVAAQQQQADYTATVLSGDRALSDFLVSSTLEEVVKHPPDTTGLRPDGQVASWSARQAIGAPDTPQAGDEVTAWASRSPDGGEEWLQLSYERPVDIAQINVHETYNPGAVSRISALLPDGSEKTLWEGTEPPEQAPVEVGFPVPPGVRSDQIKVYMDTARVPGWNEVDAVELVGSDGSRQWATGSSASSYYGDRR